ncbi:hypothetical protein IQ265_28175 [Nodosilinea sp. LEGE 06152]|uniref:hypothetical protein n=1 Tax=Nodosilinea sp. LEGE 06152 TaxID=2777966 RepID=UPI00187F89F3|nr:hypothetical protein [Nodosilinea sp. LEGE 06152]MBE9160670.1 hypothetical protein [Nodosilinea sp. LEGE 06152]
MYGTQNGFFGQIIGGLVIVMIAIPALVKSLSRDNVDLNGVSLDIAETVLEAVTQRDWNFGDASRSDTNWETPE